jgi:hypothetical protein
MAIKHRGSRRFAESLTRRLRRRRLKDPNHSYFEFPENHIQIQFDSETNFEPQANKISFVAGFTPVSDDFPARVESLPEICKRDIWNIETYPI